MVYNCWWLRLRGLYFVFFFSIPKIPTNNMICTHLSFVVVILAFAFCTLFGIIATAQDEEEEYEKYKVDFGVLVFQEVFLSSYVVVP